MQDVDVKVRAVLGLRHGDLILAVEDIVGTNQGLGERKFSCRLLISRNGETFSTCLITKNCLDDGESCESCFDSRGCPDSNVSLPVVEQAFHHRGSISFRCKLFPAGTDQSKAQFIKDNFTKPAQIECHGAQSTMHIENMLSGLRNLNQELGKARDLLSLVSFDQNSYGEWCANMLIKCRQERKAAMDVMNHLKDTFRSCWNRFSMKFLEKRGAKRLLKAAFRCLQGQQQETPAKNRRGSQGRENYDCLGGDCSSCYAGKAYLQTKVFLKLEIY